MKEASSICPRKFRRNTGFSRGCVLVEKDKMWFLFQFLHEVEESISPEAEKQVMIEKAINLRLLCDYVVSCSYGDVVLIICMLHDYVKRLDELRADDIVYQAYYREKFMKMADRLSEQIGYDYDKAVEKCMKKQQKKESSSDIGGDAMALALKYGTKGKKKEGEANAGADNKKEMV